MRRILLVDDDPRICLVIRAWLKRYGFEVSIADGGADGLAGPGEIPHGAGDSCRLSHQASLNGKAWYPAGPARKSGAKLSGVSAACQASRPEFQRQPKWRITWTTI